MTKKKMTSLLLRTGVTTLILIILVAAAGCAGSTTAESPDVVESPGTTEVTEVPQETETNEETEAQHEDGEQDEDTEEAEQGALDEEAEETEHAKPDEDAESFEDDESNSSSEQTFTAEELGLIVIDEGIRPPDFTLPTLEGPDITLSAFQGSYVVLNFWSTNCPPCVAEMGYFEVVGKQHPDELAILTIDIRESDSKVSDFFGDGERNFIAALDKTGEVTSLYGIRYTPTTFFIDTEGNVPYAKVGAFSSQQHFEESVALLMST